MDSRQFRQSTLYPPVNNARIREVAIDKTVIPVTTLPIEDARYPGYAAIMSDGRLVTDYRSHCAYNYNIPKYGNSVRSWMQNNAEGIMQVTRMRLVDKMGSQYKMAPTVPSGSVYTKCDEFECNMVDSHSQSGIGLVRRERVPELFGTFYNGTKDAPSPKGISLTHVFEGGRNTPRGR